MLFRSDTVCFIKKVKVGIIVELNLPSPMPYGVKFDDDVWLWFLSENELEKVEEPTYKEGDKVRVKSILYPYLNGKVGVIEEVRFLRPIPYAVKLDCDNSPWFLSENDLEKVEKPTNEEETTESIIDEIKTKWSEINILLNRLEKKEKVE